MVEVWWSREIHRWIRSLQIPCIIYSTYRKFVVSWPAVVRRSYSEPHIKIGRQAEVSKGSEAGASAFAREPLEQSAGDTVRPGDSLASDAFKLGIFAATSWR